MRRFLVGVLIGICLMAEPLPAFRMTKPPVITEWNTNTMTQLNDTLELLWYITNGRYTPEVVTTDPDGNLKGDKGDFVLYIPAAGNKEACWNVDGAKDWDCATLS